MNGSETTAQRSRWPLLAAAVLGVAFLLCLHTGGQFLRPGWMVSFVWLIPAALCVAWWKGGDAHREAEPELGPGVVLAGFLVLYLYSSAVLFRWFYFEAWAPGAGWGARLLSAPTARLMLFAAVLTPFFLWRRRRVSWVAAAVLLIGVALCFRGLWTATGGLPIYRDDHPSFMFRLWLFAENFPRLSYYDPYWAAGEVGVHTIASGTQGIGLVFLPLWRFLDIEKIYTPILGISFIVGVPLLAAWSVRLAGGKATSAWVAACLALGISPYYFLWLLHFGTLGSSFASPFIMPVCACLYRVLWHDDRRLRTAVALMACAALFLVWPVSGFMAAAPAVAVLVCAKAWTRARVLFLLSCAAVIGLLVLPAVLTILGHANVSAFAEIPSRPTGWMGGLQQGWRRVQSHAWQVHPLVLFFGLGGIWFLKDRGLRRFYGAVFVVLLLLAGWGEAWKPQFQLSRAGIPLWFTATVPASLWLGRLLESRARWLAPVQGMLVVLLLFGATETANIYARKSRIKYRPMPEEIVDFVAWLKGHTEPDARVLFAGAATHGYGAGHVAYLPRMAGREMLACDYYHFSPQRVEYQNPPSAFLTSEQALSGYLEMYNVGYVATYHKKWREFLSSRPEEYEEVYNFGKRLKKTVYKVRREHSFFQEGSGTVRAALNTLEVKVDDPAAPAVLRYTWSDYLSADEPVAIAPRDMGHGIYFIEVHPNGQAVFQIRYKKWP